MGSFFADLISSDTIKAAAGNFTDSVKSIMPPAFNAIAGDAADMAVDFWNTISDVAELRAGLIEEHKKDPSKSKLTNAASKNSHGIKSKKRKLHSEEKMYHFRIDWIRKLEYALTGSMTKTTQQFKVEEDLAFMLAIFQFQYHQFGKKKATGIIDATTRLALEDKFDALSDDPLGENLESRTLVPGGATKEQKFQYYRKIIESNGGIFESGANRSNVLAIRGVLITEDGAIEQTEGAKEAKAKLDAGNSTNYFNSKGTDWEGSKRAADDIIVSMWIDELGIIHLTEKIGTTSFATVQNAEGGPTLRDGQYKYELGRHSTSFDKHAENVEKATGSKKKKKKRSSDENKANETLNPSKDGSKYNALVPHDKFEVWRAGEGTNLTQSEIDNSKKKIAEQDNNYIGRQGINFHTGTEKGVSTTGCQNLEISDYLGFMEDIQKNKEAFENMNLADLMYFGFTEEEAKEMMKKESVRYTIPYTLIDASKIDSGLVLIKSELKE